MSNRNEMYKCELCGQIIEVVIGGGELKCCEQVMNLLAENTVDAAVEKHIPVIEKVEGGIKVKVGEVAHPMEESHYIQWIEVISGDKVLRTHLNPGDAPEAVFNITGDNLIVREYCNLHGHWKA